MILYQKPNAPDTGHILEKIECIGVNSTKWTKIATRVTFDKKEIKVKVTSSC